MNSILVIQLELPTYATIKRVSRDKHTYIFSAPSHVVGRSLAAESLTMSFAGATVEKYKDCSKRCCLSRVSETKLKIH